MAEVNKNSRTMKIRYAQDVLEAMTFTSEIAHLLGYSQSEPLFLTLVVEESLMNALEYGEGNDVTIQWKPKNENLVISVKQKGSPFTIEKKVGVNEGPRGRGMQLILNIMDKVWLEQEGDHYITLYMEKKTTKQTFYDT